MTDETVSVGSPKISIMKLPDVPENITTKIKTNIGQETKRHPGMSHDVSYKKR